MSSEHHRDDGVVEGTCGSGLCSTTNNLPGHLRGDTKSLIIVLFYIARAMMTVRVVVGIVFVVLQTPAQSKNGESRPDNVIKK